MSQGSNYLDPNRPDAVRLIAFGFPSTDGPVIFDIGTASLMWGEVFGFFEVGDPARKSSDSLRVSG